MSKELEILLAESRRRRSTPEEDEAQRRSFAYGNTHFENESITREMVNRAAEALKAANATSSSPKQRGHLA